MGHSEIKFSCKHSDMNLAAITGYLNLKLRDLYNTSIKEYEEKKHDKTFDNYNYCN